MSQPPRSAVIFGARNLGRAVVETLITQQWSVAAVARSQRTLDTAAARARWRWRASVTASLRAAAEAHGGVDLIVNAASAYGGSRSGPFGGGPIAQADAEAFDSWAAAPARAAFTFLAAAGAFAVQRGRPATLVQVTGGSSRRAMAGRGLWAAGAFGVRAITQAAALELREQGIHVALLIVDAGIQPIDGTTREGVEPAALADPHEIADAVLFLAQQGARAATHELQVTPLKENWVP
jgi:NAD(P)-dependent dehydrogenase (short-subunit alcohol dehydrogenase family)